MIPAIVLAAGRSSRMGRPKPSLELPGGDTFLTRIVRTLTAAGVPRTYVVIAIDALDRDRSERDLASWPATRVVINEAPDRGQLSSLQSALAAVGDGPSALLLTLVDLPLIRADTVRHLIEAYDRTRAPLIRPARNGMHGHPILFDREVADRLSEADAMLGARPIVRRFADRAIDVPIDDDGSYIDVDTQSDLTRLQARLG